MKIAITADPLIPVPPENYGGIERIIDFLATGLLKRGHEVLLVANSLSTVEVPLLGYKGNAGKWSNHLKNILTVSSLGHFNPDVIHSFGRLAYLLPFMRSAVPKIMSYQREPTLSQVKRSIMLARKNSLSFTGCSNYITDKIKPFATANTVYNGIDINKYQFNETVAENAPLVFLGRIEPIKGIKTAINVAIATDKQLLIAGNVPVEYTGYFEQEVKPFFNEHIKYIGPVNDAQKNELLNKASALLMPVSWDEPFGIVMAEAMACGTPVIGFNRGSIPEVIRDGINGYRCDTWDEMISLVSKIKDLDRAQVRKDAEARFSSEVIIDEYLAVYNHAIHQQKNNQIKN